MADLVNINHVESFGPSAIGTKTNSYATKTK
jgi:hypothetical protein